MTRVRFFALALLLLAARALAQVSGTVTLVTDGDTLWVRPDAESGRASKPRAFRLRGIDAPEICQPWGAQAKAALEGRVLHRRVRLRNHATDAFERTVATLEVDGEDIGAWMVGQGHAWNAKFRYQPGAYAVLEQSARNARRGLFAHDSAIEPHRFRKTHGSCGRH
jgi:micrococcal nuclease